MKISVIIPVYNVELHLRQCIDSVLKQTYVDLEIILVNDGSTDSSGQICDEFVGKDIRISVIHQQNAGVSAARNVGIRHASGDYLTFVDSDDWLDSAMYAEMISLGSLADVIMCDFTTFKNGSGDNITSFLRNGYYTKDNIIREIYPTLLVTEDFGRIPIVSTCICLFKFSLLNNFSIKFDEELRFSEDYLFMATVMVHAETFFYLKGKFFYQYRQYEESRSKKFQYAWWNNLKRLNERLKYLLAQNNDYDFNRQIKLQLIHSALLVSGAVVKNSQIEPREKVSLLSGLFADSELMATLCGMRYSRLPFSLKIVLYLMRIRKNRVFLNYSNLVSYLNSLKK